MIVYFMCIKAIKKMYNNNKNHAGDFPTFSLQNNPSPKMKNRYHFPHKIFLCIIHRRTHTNALMIRTHQKKKKFEHTMGHASERKTHENLYYPEKGEYFHDSYVEYYIGFLCVALSLQ